MEGRGELAREAVEWIGSFRAITKIGNWLRNWRRRREGVVKEMGSWVRRSRDGEQEWECKGWNTAGNGWRGGN